MYTFFTGMLPDTNDVVYKICKTTRAKKILNSILILILAFFLRTILYSIFAWVVAIMFSPTRILNNAYVEFIVQCLLSIYLCAKNEFIQKKIERFEPQIYNLTRYAVNNYSQENFRKWKNYAIFITLFFSYVYCSLFEITSSLIKIYILQYAICYIFLDIYENPNSFVGRNWYKIKYYKRNYKDDNVVIIDKSIYESDIGSFIAIDKITLTSNDTKTMGSIGSMDDFVLVDK